MNAFTADMVTFSKKMQAAGFYHNLCLRPSQTYRNFNTWMGDLVRAYQAQVIIESIDKHNLLEVVKDTGVYLKTRLLELRLAIRFGLIDAIFQALEKNIGQCFFAFRSHLPSLPRRNRGIDLFFDLFRRSNVLGFAHARFVN